jgi:fructose/tagatose bisphosphate aldolase
MKEDVQPLNLALVGEIASLTGIPLVLHGSSGVVRTREEAHSCGIPLAPHEGSVVDGIARGIAKVNVSTELQATYLEAVREHLERSPAIKDVRKVFKFAREALTEKVRSYIRLFGSSGKA